MRKIQRRDFLKAMGLATAALGLTACGGSGAASASSVSSAPASSSSAPSASACDWLRFSRRRISAISRCAVF